MKQIIFGSAIGSAIAGVVAAVVILVWTGELTKVTMSTGDKFGNGAESVGAVLPSTMLFLLTLVWILFVCHVLFVCVMAGIGNIRYEEKFKDKLMEAGIWLGFVALVLVGAWGGFRCLDWFAVFVA